jgi:geranylgeranyl pyrophosphate synthase
MHDAAASGCDRMAWQAARLARLHTALEYALPAADHYPTRLHTAMRYACEGGKRLRGLLVYAAGEALALDAALLDAPAVAVELIHAYSLAHDDLPAMDDDDLRRGRATVHKAFDEATAILTGDALQTLAFTVLAEADQPGTAARLRMVQLLAAASGSRGMAGGQQADLEAEGQSLTLAALQTLHAHKTGALIRCCGLLAAAAANATVAQQRSLTDFGEALGLAYQIQDDVLDVTASSVTLGKTAGKDVTAEKSTYVRLLGLEPARQEAARLFAQAASSLAVFGPQARALRDLLDKIQHRNA